MMKYIKISLLSLFSVSVFTGCGDWLDASPKTQIRAEDLFTDATGFTEALEGLYILMGEREGYGGYMSWEALEFMAWSHVNTTDGGAWYDLQRYNYDNSKPQGFVTNVWNKLYNVISNANYLIMACDMYGGDLNPGFIHSVRGQALAVRAYCHFDLIRLFGPGNLLANPASMELPCVPYVTDYASYFTPQKSVEETLEMLMDDIESAMDEFDQSTYSTGGNRNMNAAAIRLLRARVALWMGDENTLDYASEIVQMFESGGMGSITWSTNNPVDSFISEVLFGINPYDLVDYMEHAYDLHVEGTINRNFLLSPEESFVQDDLFLQGSRPLGTSASDIRYAHWYADFSDTSVGVVGKMTVKVRPTDNERNEELDSFIPLLRISEAYLIAAEAYITASLTKEQTINTPAAIELINKLRAARSVSEDYYIPSDTQTAIVRQALLYEGLREFVQEGQSFFLYKRLNTPQMIGQRAVNYAIPMTEAKYMLPYPKGEQEFGRTNGLD